MRFNFISFGFKNFTIVVLYLIVIIFLIGILFYLVIDEFLNDFGIWDF